jgi:hypothetical protein
MAVEMMKLLKCHETIPTVRIVVIEKESEEVRLIHCISTVPDNSYVSCWHHKGQRLPSREGL